MTEKRQRNWQLMYLLFLIIGVLAFLVVLYSINLEQNKNNRILKQNQIASCIRGIVTREAANSNSIVLIEFLRSAVDARIRDASVTTGRQHQANLVTAKIWKSLIKRIKLVPPPICAKEVK